MELPDVIGFVLDEALDEIREKGLTVGKLIVTKPLKATEPLGKARVVRLLLLEDAILQVVVAYEDYGKGGVQYGLQDYR